MRSFSLGQPLFSPALVAALALMATPALAQTAAPVVLQPRTTPATTPQTHPLVHVNARAGSDTSGDGSQLRPYQTITHALQRATPNAIVLLAPGEYSEANGERFPIQLRTGVTVQGAPNGGLGQTVIRGSGIFASTTAGMVQATLVGADGAGLGHVTVTNTSTAGYGLVVEAGRPAIRQNQFVGSGYGGMYVSGHSAPVLEGNQFSGNGVVGLVLSGQTAAEVRGNRFEQTGIGIRVAPGAQPQIVNNTIVQNQEGLILDGSANPILQDNVIAQNRRNGVVEFQTALKAEASAPTAILPSVAAVPSRQQDQDAPTVALAPPGIQTPPAVQASPEAQAPTIIQTPPAVQVPSAVQASPEAQTAPVDPSAPAEDRATVAISEPPPRDRMTASVSESIPIAVIPPPVDTVARASHAPARSVAPPARPVATAQPSSNPAPIPTNPDVLPVPDRRIPIGSGGSAIPNLAPPTTVLALNGATPAPPSHRGLLGLVYTVVVPAADAATQAQVRAVVADAFRVNLGGQPMMQVGAYADQATAEAKANELIAQGYAARVEYRP